MPSITPERYTVAAAEPFGAGAGFGCGRGAGVAGGAVTSGMRVSGARSTGGVVGCTSGFGIGAAGAARTDAGAPARPSQPSSEGRAAPAAGSALRAGRGA